MRRELYLTGKRGDEHTVYSIVFISQKLHVLARLFALDFLLLLGYYTLIS